MRRELAVRVVELCGDAYENGVKQGENVVLDSKFHFMKEMQSQVDTEKAREFLKKHAPIFLEELRGVADARGISFDEAIRIYSGYDVVMPPMGCSALANGTYYARNYDFSPDIYDARLVFMKEKHAYASVGFSQQIVGRLDGMNEKGLVVGIHLVNEKHRVEGFLATSIARFVLDHCSNVDEAIEYIIKTPHEYCYNFSLTDSSGKSVLIEASPEKQHVYRNAAFVCANHFETKSMLGSNRTRIEASLKRKKCMNALLEKNLTAMDMFKKFNDENSPLFFKYYKEFFGTLHTVVYSPQDLQLKVGIGGNCNPFVFSLRDWLEDKATLPEILRGSIER